MALAGLIAMQLTTGSWDWEPLLAGSGFTVARATTAIVATIARNGLLQRRALSAAASLNLRYRKREMLVGHERLPG
jgi:hypothetical protein